MSFLNTVVLRDNPLDCPFVPKKKPWIGAALGALGTLVSGLLGNASQNSAQNQNWDIAQLNAQSQRETNETNERIAKQANDMNYRMFLEQNAYNTDMWNKTNLYNLPVNEVQRLLAAGINPAAFYGRGASATMQSSASSAPAQTAYHTAPQLNYQAQPLDLGYVGDVVDAYANTATNFAELRNKQAEADYNEAKAEYEWNSLEARVQHDFNTSERGSLDNAIARENLDIIRGTKEARINRERNESFMSEKLLDEKELDIASKKMTNEMLQSDVNWRNKFNAANYQTLINTNKKVLSEISVNNAEVALKSAQTGVEEMRKNGLEISNEQADKLVDLILEKADYEAEEANYNAGRAERLYYEGRGAEAPINKLGDAAYPDSNKRKNRSRRYPVRDTRKGR